jgi:hypothetical protein
VTGFLWLAAFLALPICGWPLLSHPAYGRFSIPARVVLSGAAGAALLSFTMTAAVLAGLEWRITTLVLGSVLLAYLLRLLAGESEVDESAHDDGGPAWAWLAHLVSLAAVATAFVAAASGAASSPDLLFFWGPKAQHYAMARTIDAGFLGSAFHQFMHPYYPPLVTNVFAFASMAAGRLPWTAAILTFPLLLAALALGLPGLMRENAGRARAAAISALAVAAIAYAGMEADIGGNGEMPLLVFEALAVAILLSPCADERPGQLLAGILLAGAAVTKVEGLPFAVAAAGLAVLASRRPARAAARSFLALLGPAAVALVVWFGFGATRGLFAGYSASGRCLALYPDRLLAVVKTIAVNLLAAGHGLPWIVPFVCLLAAVPLSRRALVPLGTAAVLGAFFVFTYLHRPEDPSLWISWSAARIFTPLAMLLALTSSAASGPPATRTPGPTPG